MAIRKAKLVNYVSGSAQVVTRRTEINIIWVREGQYDVWCRAAGFEGKRIEAKDRKRATKKAIDMVSKQLRWMMKGWEMDLKRMTKLTKTLTQELTKLSSRK